MKLTVVLNNLKRQELDKILLTLLRTKKVTLEELIRLNQKVSKRKELLNGNQDLVPLYNLKTKFKVKKLSKLAEIVPYQAFTYDSFLIPEIYEKEIEESVGEHYLPEKRKEFENNIFDELTYLNKFIKQTKQEQIGRYTFQEYKYIVYLFKHKYLNFYIKDNPDSCKLSLQADDNERKFVSVIIKDKYRFHIPEGKIYFRKRIIIPKTVEEYVPSDSEIVEVRTKEYFNRMYILMDYYLNFVLIW